MSRLNIFSRVVRCASLVFAPSLAMLAGSGSQKKALALFAGPAAWFDPAWFARTTAGLAEGACAEGREAELRRFPFFLDEVA